MTGFVDQYREQVPDRQSRYQHHIHRELVPLSDVNQNEAQYHADEYLEQNIHPAPLPEFAGLIRIACEASGIDVGETARHGDNTLFPSQLREPAGAFGDTRFHVDRRVQIPCFLPEESRLCVFAGVAFQERQASNGVCQVERCGLLMAAINGQGFVVAGFSQVQMSLILVDVSHVADSVSQPERIALHAVDRDGFFVVLSRDFAVFQVSLNLPQARESLR
jgi:hypothetical protein